MRRRGTVASIAVYINKLREHLQIDEELIKELKNSLLRVGG